MQRLEVSVAVRPIYGSLGVKRLNNSNYINYKHFVNMKGTIYGNTLPRNRQVKKGWEPL